AYKKSVKLAGCAYERFCDIANFLVENVSGVRLSSWAKIALTIRIGISGVKCENRLDYTNRSIV
ncbi:hypothetical protein LCGC14_1085790, partial [marine sediment metagenome]